MGQGESDDRDFFFVKGLVVGEWCPVEKVLAKV